MLSLENRAPGLSPNHAARPLNAIHRRVNALVQAHPDHGSAIAMANKEEPISLVDIKGHVKPTSSLNKDVHQRHDW